ncbi:MAG: copper resistance protein CopC [Ardenticatenales bacterium]
MRTPMDRRSTVASSTRWARAAAVVVLSAIAAPWMPAPGRVALRVAAHSETVMSDPAPGDVRPTSPGAVTLGFTDPLRADSRITVVDDAFAEASAGVTTIEAADPRRMTVPLKPGLPDGLYTVQWTAVDNADGHATSGSYTFSVGVGVDGAAPSPRSPATRTEWAILAAIAAALATGGYAVRRAPLAIVALVTIGLSTSACAAPTPTASNALPNAVPSAAVSSAAVSSAAVPSAAVSSAAVPSAAAPVGALDATAVTASADDQPTDDPKGVPIQIAIAASDLAVGQERFAFAILDVNNQLVPDVDATATFFHLDGDGASEAGHAPATYYASTLPEAGTYVALTTFDRAGPWGVAISGTLPDGRTVAPNRVRFDVASRPKSPAVGDAAPATANRTLRTEPDIALLTSDPMPDPDLYAMTVDEAVKSGKATVVVFATPGYCQSRICGPVVDEVKALAKDWRDRVNFIHIEVYKSFSPLVLADEMALWGLDTEPWTFVLTRDGHVAARLEGNATKVELEPIIERVVGQN